MDPRTFRSPDLDPRKLSRQLAELYYRTEPPSTGFIQFWIVVLYVLAIFSISCIPGCVFTVLVPLSSKLAFGMMVAAFVVGALVSLALVTSAQLLSSYLAMTVHIRQTRDMIFYLLVNDPPPKK